MALLGAAWIPMWFFLNLYLQQILGYGAFESGAALLPMTVLIMLVMIGVTGRVVARYGVKSPIVVGLGLLAAGIGLLGRAPVDGNFVLDVLSRLADRRSRDVARLHPVADRRALSRSARRRQVLPQGLSTRTIRSAPRSGSPSQVQSRSEQRTARLRRR